LYSATQPPLFVVEKLNDRQYVYHTFEELHELRTHQQRIVRVYSWQKAFETELWRSRRSTLLEVVVAHAEMRDRFPI